MILCTSNPWAPNKTFPRVHSNLPCLTSAFSKLSIWSISNSYTKRKKKDEENYSISHRLRKKAELLQAAGLSTSSFLALKPTQTPGVIRRKQHGLSPKAVLPPQRRAGEAWPVAKDALSSSLGRQWDGNHSF